MDFHQRHLRLRPTPNDLDIRDFHPYLYILRCLEKYFQIPTWG
nr:MAG TPA: hypothetical protein [Caudoviricetes sp.]